MPDNFDYSDPVLSWENKAKVSSKIRDLAEQSKQELNTNSNTFEEDKRAITQLYNDITDVIEEKEEEKLNIIREGQRFRQKMEKSETFLQAVSPGLIKASSQEKREDQWREAINKTYDTLLERREEELRKLSEIQEKELEKVKALLEHRSKSTTSNEATMEMLFKRHQEQRKDLDKIYQRALDNLNHRIYQSNMDFYRLAYKKQRVARNIDESGKSVETFSNVDGLWSQLSESKGKGDLAAFNELPALPLNQEVTVEIFNRAEKNLLLFSVSKAHHVAAKVTLKKTDSTGKIHAEIKTTGKVEPRDYTELHLRVMHELIDQGKTEFDLHSFIANHPSCSEKEWHQSIIHLCASIWTKNPDIKIETSLYKNGDNDRSVDNLHKKLKELNSQIKAERTKIMKKMGETNPENAEQLKRQSLPPAGTLTEDNYRVPVSPGATDGQITMRPVPSP